MDHKRLLSVALAVVALSGCSRLNRVDTARPAKSVGHGTVMEASDRSFKDIVLSSDLPVVVDFYTTWCGPCKLMEPIMEQSADKFKGKLRFVRVDAEESPITSRQYHIRGYPTFLFFKSGKPVAIFVGAVHQEGMNRILTEFVQIAAKPDFPQAQ